MVSRDEIIYAFRLLLGRDPEDKAVVDNLLSVPTWANLREVFLASPEFQAKSRPNAFTSGTTDFVTALPNPVEVEVGDDQFDKLVGHVQASWEALGREQPHWSVLTNPKFLPENIAANVASFYETGEGSVDILLKAAARANKPLPWDGTCFELGCGVGRITAFLASRFNKVIAADISEPHLQLAAEHLRLKSLDNVELKHLQSLATLEALETVDLFYSIIVLQHNPPPLIYRMLQIILGKIKRGGFVYFQVPVAYPNYSFSIGDYIHKMERGEQTMEMHVLPQPYLFGLLDEHRFRILDLQRDNWPGPSFNSYTIFAEKIG